MTGLTALSRIVLGPRLVEYELRSTALGRRSGLRVLLPDGYAEGTAFPVLYLLHGGGDDFRSWTDKGGATEATESVPMVVVMPDAGNGGFYSDWVRDDAHGRPKWETYHLTELLPWVDATFRTDARREGRALAGLSMGGFGAMSYAARYPDLFVGAASFSGAVDTNLYTFIPNIAAGRDGGAPGAIWGDRRTSAIRWRAHNPWDLAGNLRGMALAVRTGTGLPGPLNERGTRPDPVESIVCHESFRLHTKLRRLRIPHEWHCGNGTHDWPYWTRDLRATLPLLCRTFDHPPAALTSFEHTSAEADYEVRGWTVHMTRPVTEFSTLSAEKNRFSLTGRGSATVRTAPSFRPDDVHMVVVDGQSLAVRADAEGRLTVPLRLGARRARTVGVVIR